MPLSCVPSVFSVLFVLLNRTQKQQQQQLVSSSFLPEADRTVVEDWGIHNCGVAKVEQKECLPIGLDLAQQQQHNSSNIQACEVL